MIIFQTLRAAFLAASTFVSPADQLPLVNTEVFFAANCELTINGANLGFLSRMEEKEFQENFQDIVERSLKIHMPFYPHCSDGREAKVFITNNKILTEVGHYSHKNKVTGATGLKAKILEVYEVRA